MPFWLLRLRVPLMWAFHVSRDLRWPSDDIAFGLTLAVSLFVAYAGTFVFGLPLYFFLRARQITSFVVAPAFGLIIGALATWLVAGRYLTPDFLQFGGLSGAAVGAVLWLIARPGRRTQQRDVELASSDDKLGG